VLGQLALPYPQHPPPGASQGARHQGIAPFVVAEFLPPERRIVFGLGRVFGATVPETTVHENGEPLPGKDKIRSHGEIAECRVQSADCALLGLKAGLRREAIPHSAFRNPNLDLSAPSRDSVGAQQFCQRQFRVLVSAPANARHYLRPLPFGEDFRILLARNNFRPHP